MDETELLESIEAMVRHLLDMIPAETDVQRIGHTITIQIKPW